MSVVKYPVLFIVTALVCCMFSTNAIANTENGIVDEEAFYDSDILSDIISDDINSHTPGTNADQAIAKEKAAALDSGISAKAAILVEALTGRVLYAKNEHTRLPIASTTKIMTTLLTLESGGMQETGLDEYFKIDENSIKVEGSSMGLLPGDSITKRGLAYGMLLASGNDSANAAAVKLAGSLPAFSEMMNRRSREIGMTNTNFVTPSGLDAPEHYSTAYDMALLGREAIKNPDFLSICQQKTASLEYGNPPYKRWLKNHNRMLREYTGCFGIKTGFTKKSGRCLVTAAERNGVRLVAVVLNAPGDWSDSKRLMDYGFSVVKLETIEVDVSDVEVNITGGLLPIIKVEPAQELKAPITERQKAELTRVVKLRQFYYAPVAAGDILGEVCYYLDGKNGKSRELIASAALLAKNSADRKITEIKLSLWEKLGGFFSRLF